MQRSYQSTNLSINLTATWPGRMVQVLWHDRALLNGQAWYVRRKICPDAVISQLSPALVCEDPCRFSSRNPRPSAVSCHSLLFPSLRGKTTFSPEEAMCFHIGLHSIEPSPRTRGAHRLVRRLELPSPERGAIEFQLCLSNFSSWLAPHRPHPLSYTTWPSPPAMATQHLISPGGVGVARSSAPYSRLGVSRP